MENDKGISLPSTALTIAAATELRDKHGIDKWKGPWGLINCRFTEDELLKIEELKFENITEGSLEGIELFPHLKRLTVICDRDNSYTAPRDIVSIGDDDVARIEKITQLESLSLINQANVTEIDLSKLPKLWNVEINYNTNLETISGIDKLPELSYLSCFGNESLHNVNGLDKAIVQNRDIWGEVELDTMLFPKAVGYKVFDGSYNQEAIESLRFINSGMDVVRWSEALHYGTKTQINTYQMLKMHNKACHILDTAVPRVASVKDTVVALERYLAENVTYDYDSLEHNHTKVKDGIVRSAKNGVNGSYDCLVLNSCVCQGYTRGEQYLLGLRGIKTRAVSCIAGEDKLGMSDRQDINNSFVVCLPKDGYHSIIRIDDYYCLYSDPCWNAGHYQRGDKSMPYTLRTKDEIRKTHTLSYDEAIIDNATGRVDRSEVAASLRHNEAFRNTRLRDVQAQQTALKPNVIGVIRGYDGKTH